MNKVCNKCWTEKDISEFYSKINQCKVCYKQCVKDYYANNKEKVKDYYNNNKERIKEKNKSYYNNNKEWIKEKVEEYNKTENGRRMQRKSARKQYSTHFGKEKSKACSKLRCAVKIGEVIKPCNCQCCDSISRLEAHHHSYKKGFELDVIWVCKSCHTAMHNAIKDLNVVLPYE